MTTTLKTRIAASVALLALLFTACTPAATVAPAIPPQVPPTSTPVLATAAPPPAPADTPTATPVPTAALPDVIQATYRDTAITHRVENFGTLVGSSPTDWASYQKPYVRNDGSLEITGANNIVFYNGAPISPNTAVSVGFKFNAGSNFTIGLDREENNQRIPYAQPGFRTFSAEFRGAPTVNLWTDKGHTRYRFNGDLKLQPDNWYMLTMGLTGDKRFLVKIWDSQNPGQDLTYTMQASGMPDSYYFIMWVDAKSTFYLKDFAVFTFTDLSLE